MTKLLNELRTRAGVRSLLSDVGSNPKVAKNGKLGVYTSVLHLSPGNTSGHEVCPKRSPGCSAACLHYAGSPAHMAAKDKARLKRTRLLFADRDLFMNILALEIAAHIRGAKRRNMEPAIRLNGTSDIVWEVKRFKLYPDVARALAAEGDTIVSLFPTVQFYDYTAILNRNPPENYHLTFSLKEQNTNEARLALLRGHNVAAVFFDDLPEAFMGREVIDGDEHDYRPADPKGVIVGLKAKGVKGKKDQTGFVNSYNSPSHLLAA